MAAPASPNSLLAALFSGAVRGGDPYANQAADKFASSPRVYGRPLPGGPAPAAAAAAAPPGRAVPVPASRPAGGGGGGGGGGGHRLDIPVPLSRPDNPNTPNPLQAAVDAAPGTGPGPMRLWDRPNPLQAAVDAAPYTGPMRGGLPDRPVYPQPQPYGGPTAAADAAPYQPYPAIFSDQDVGYMPSRPYSPTPSQGPFPTVSSDQDAGYMPSRPYSPTRWARRATWG